MLQLVGPAWHLALHCSEESAEVAVGDDQRLHCLVAQTRAIFFNHITPGRPNAFSGRARSTDAEVPPGKSREERKGCLVDSPPAQRIDIDGDRRERKIVV